MTGGYSWPEFLQDAPKPAPASPEVTEDKDGWILDLEGLAFVSVKQTDAGVDLSVADDSSASAMGALLTDAQVFKLVNKLMQRIPHTFVQHKGTEMCADHYCACGEQFHIDCDFQYYVKCKACGQHYELGYLLPMRAVSEKEGGDYVKEDINQDVCEEMAQEHTTAMLEKELSPLKDFSRQQSRLYSPGPGPFPYRGPHPNGIACPECGKELWDTSPDLTLTSHPPQKNVHCPECRYAGYRIA